MNTPRVATKEEALERLKELKRLVEFTIEGIENGWSRSCESNDGWEHKGYDFRLGDFEVRDTWKHTPFREQSYEPFDPLL